MYLGHVASGSPRAVSSSPAALDAAVLGLPQKMMFARAAARRLPPTARRFSEAPQKLDRAARLAAGGQATGEETGTTAALWASVAASTAVISGGIYSLMADPEESSLAKAAQ